MSFIYFHTKQQPFTQLLEYFSWDKTGFFATPADLCLKCQFYIFPVIAYFSQFCQLLSYILSHLFPNTSIYLCCIRTDLISFLVKLTNPFVVQLSPTRSMNEPTRDNGPYRICKQRRLACDCAFAVRTHDAQTQMKVWTKIRHLAPQACAFEECLYRKKCHYLVP